MVSHEQRRPGSHGIIGPVIAFAFVAMPVFAQQSGKTFYPDDPLLREPAPRPVKHAEARHVDELFDFLANSFATPRTEGRVAHQGSHPVSDANTLGDVPDNSWYTNRHFYHRMSIDELKRGPGNTTPPARNGQWRVISAKTNGVTPGFEIEDEHNNRYVLKLDPPDNPELASAPDVIGSKAFYALGYNTPENYIVHFRRENLELAEGVTVRDSSGRKLPLTARVLDEMLRPQPRRPDGTYRGMASRYLPGELLGPFSYAGMRTDDPNDIVAHENRRELRGLAVFAAWLNHHDTKAINTMDSLVAESGVHYLRHYLLDFGDILGSDGGHPKHAWSGHEYTIELKSSAVEIATLGLYMPRWVRADYPMFPGTGRFDSWSFDPIAWKPNYPNPAFLLMDREDAFWAAKQVAAFSDAEIRALVETGEYSDPTSADWIAQCLIERRDKIAEAWLSDVSPLDKFNVVDGKLVFEDLRAKRSGAAPRRFTVRWASWDAGGRATALPDATGPQIPAFRQDTQYLAATITSASTDDPDDRVTAYVQRGQAGLQVVGVDR